MRLDRALTLAGYSRPEAKKLIARGRVSVAGKPARDAGMNVSPDDVLLDGAAPGIETELYLMLNKPAGVITATQDRSLPTVLDLLPDKYRRRKIGPVGRLDRDVTGLVLLTTDGTLAHRLISPRRKAEKRYRAVCQGELTRSDVRSFADGIVLSDFTTRPARLIILEAGEERSLADVILTEGKFHQIKRMFAATGHPLLTLERLQIGCVTLDETLAPGEFRPLTAQEIAGLKALTGLDGEE